MSSLIAAVIKCLSALRTQALQICPVTDSSKDMSFSGRFKLCCRVVLERLFTPAKLRYVVPGQDPVRSATSKPQAKPEPIGAYLIASGVDITKLPFQSRSLLFPRAPLPKILQPWSAVFFTELIGCVSDKSALRFDGEA